MQWTYDRTFQFSRAPPAVLFAERAAPPILESRFGEVVDIHATSEEASHHLSYRSRMLEACIDADYAALQVRVMLGPASPAGDCPVQAGFAARFLKTALDETYRRLSE